MTEEIRPAAPGSAAHEADATDAHDASSISVTPAGNITSTDVQAALVELDGDIAAGGIPATIVDAKGDLIVATAADTVARRAVGADGTVLTADAAEATGVKWAAGGGGLSSGTSFPGSPANNDLFYRTDLDLLFFFDGTRWLTAQLFTTTLSVPAVLSVTTVNATKSPAPSLQGGSDIWLVSHISRFIVNAGTALAAGHKWVGTPHTYNSAISAATIVTVNIDSGSNSVYRVIDSAIGALMNNGSDKFAIDTTWTKTGTPGSLDVMEEFTYRVVAT